MESHAGNEVGNQIGNLESDGTRFIDAAMGGGVDGVDGNLAAAGGQAGSRERPMLTMNGGGDNGGGETGERANLDNAARCENADERGEKKIVPRADAAGITDIIEMHHLVKKINLSRR